MPLEHRAEQKGLKLLCQLPDDLPAAWSATRSGCGRSC